MAKLRLPPDFSEFLKLLARHEVEYLLIGGYAVGFHGYVRTTLDMDVWIRVETASNPEGSSGHEVISRTAELSGTEVDRCLNSWVVAHAPRPICRKKIGEPLVDLVSEVIGE